MAKRGRPRKSESTSEGDVIVNTSVNTETQEITTETGINNNLGPQLFKRDENGLLLNVQYIFNEDGSVNWRAMIQEEHLFPNRSWFESRGKDLPPSITGLKDNQLLIKLSGIKELAKLRGFSNVNYAFKKCEEGHVAVTCGINFIPNYETAGEQVYFEDAANATLNNTSSFATKFLETIACNRAFVRAVRNFLNVHIVGDDEIDKSSINQQSPASFSPSLTPNGVLENEFDNFDTFKNHLRKLWQSATKDTNIDLINLLENAKDWKQFSDIPPKVARILIQHTCT